VTDLDAVLARAMPIADAVLWEGYVLYPYRRSAAKNRIRFQWGVVGPAEEPRMASTVLVDTTATDQVRVRVRFLHLHRREDGWDEAVDVHRDLDVDPASADVVLDLSVPGGEGAEPLRGTMRVTSEPDGPFMRLGVDITNSASGPRSRKDALLRSFVGCHVLFAAAGDAFV